MGQDGDRESVPRVPRMKILHLLRDGPEATANRIIAMHEGRLVGELSRDEATEERVLSLCIG